MTGARNQASVEWGLNRMMERRGACGPHSRIGRTGYKYVLLAEPLIVVDITAQIRPFGRDEVVNGTACRQPDGSWKTM